MNVPKIIELDWDDHAFEFGPWTNKGVTRVKTVGYFVYEDDDRIVVALSWSEANGPEDTQTVLKKLLIKKRLVRPAR